MDVETLSFLHGPLWVFLCVLSRLGPLLMMMPPLKGSSVPMQVRAMLAVTLAASLTPMIMGNAVELPSSLLLIAIQVAKEIMLGMLFGSAVMIILSGLQVGGQIASQLAGLDLASSADPNTEEESAVVGQLFSWLTMAIFLAMGGHRLFFSTCIGSFEMYPAGGVIAEENWLTHLPQMVHHGFSVGLRATAPISLAVFLANLVTALIGRTLPQLNILAIGFNVNALVLLAVIVLSLGGVGWVFQNELAGWIEQTTDLFVMEADRG